MKNQFLWTVLAIGAVIWATGFRAADQSGPVTIDLSKPGDALVITLSGKTVGGLRVDEFGRLGIFGPNQNSTAITLDQHDRVQIDPSPVKSPLPRLTVADDAWMTGMLRVGRPDAFGDAPFDPNGAIQVGRNLQVAQPMSMLRFFAQGREAFRIGATKDGAGFWSDGSHDVPLVTFRPSPEGHSQSGNVDIYDAALSYDQGTLTGRHPATGRSTPLIPK
jgi:hypothetical protein